MDGEELKYQVWVSFQGKPSASQKMIPKIQEPSKSFGDFSIFEVSGIIFVQRFSWLSSKEGPNLALQLPNSVGKTESFNLKHLVHMD